MPRYLRYQPEPHTLVFVTDRCFQGRFLLRPSPSVNATIVGVLARALERFEVSLYGHCFMSNHYHLLLSAGSAAHLPLAPMGARVDARSVLSHGDGPHAVN